MSILGKVVEFVASDAIAGALDKPIELLDKASKKVHEKAAADKKKLFECKPEERALLLNQAKFSWRERFNVYDNYENVAFTVKGELTSIKRHFHIYNTQGNEIGYVKEKLLSLRPSAILESTPVDFVFEMPGEKDIRMSSKFAMIKDKFSLDNGWCVEGNLIGWNYKIYDIQKNIIATVTYKSLYWGDTYLITYPENANALLILMIVLAIDVAHSPKKSEELKKTIKYKSTHFKH